MVLLWSPFRSDINVFLSHDIENWSNQNPSEFKKRFGDTVIIFWFFSFHRNLLSCEFTGRNSKA